MLRAKVYFVFLFCYNLGMQQYFSKKKEEDKLFFNEEDYHHIKNVMRIKPGNEVIVNYDGVSYLCEMLSDLRSASIKSVYKSLGDNTFIRAYIPVLNDEKMSFIIEKGTEMGVSEFIPVQYERCKFSINKDKVNKKLERYNKIAKEASEQARRLIIPEVKNIINVKDILSDSCVNIVCSLDKENVKSINKVLTSSNVCGTISIAFGPEGGLSKKEEDFLEDIGFIKTSLGDNVLRTETVIINVCSIINYLKG